MPVLTRPPKRGNARQESSFTPGARGEALIYATIPPSSLQKACAPTLEMLRTTAMDAARFALIPRLGKTGVRHNAKRGVAMDSRLAG